MANENEFNYCDKVEVNGNPEGRIIGPYGDGMYEVRLFDALRHVGDVCVPASEIKLLQRAK